MHILVLDTIHGGNEIGQGLISAGNTVDMVDIYRGTTPIEAQNAQHRDYDLIVAPVHLDPHHPLLRKGEIPVISHHEAVGRILADRIPVPMIEITGARGKTTTAHAIASLMPGHGILHTSAGTYSYPGQEVLWKKSITPASVIPAALSAFGCGGWLVAEESLGVTGVGDLAIITSAEDYAFAKGEKKALTEKLRSAKRSGKLLVAQGATTDHPDACYVEDIVQCKGNECTGVSKGVPFRISNPLLGIPEYRNPIMLAAAAAVILRLDPTPLNEFTAINGRMSVQHVNNLIVVDNANSGTDATTTIRAVRYARECSGIDDLTLVIGQMEGDGAVCEGFSFEQILYTLRNTHPDHVIWVGKVPQEGTDWSDAMSPIPYSLCGTLEEARHRALEKTSKGSIVLAVKTWR
jgi:UDP-N-acetylmuramyl pentapeptide synthase